MKICAIFNIFPLYRTPIFKEMDDNLPIDFFFGSRSSENIQLGNPNILLGFKKNINNIYVNNKLVWQRGAIRNIFVGKYTHFLLTGNTGIISNWVILLVNKILGCKTILWTHGLYGNEKGIKKFKNLLYLKLASKIFIYSDRGRNILIDNGVNSNRITTIYNSLNYKVQTEFAEKKLDLSFIRNYFGNDDPVILFIGRLTEQKRVDQLISATSISKCNYNVIVVGDGLKMEELKKQVADCALDDRFWFYGECYDESFLANLILSSKMCVSPGNCGLNAIETMTYGVPTITHSNLFNQMPEVEAVVELQQNTGVRFLFEENNIADLASVIERNLAVTNDEVSTQAKKIIAQKWNPHRQIDIMVHNLR